jgi:hypothetical protein
MPALAAKCAKKILETNWRIESLKVAQMWCNHGQAGSM